MRSRSKRTRFITIAAMSVVAGVSYTLISILNAPLGVRLAPYYWLLAVSILLAWDLFHVSDRLSASENREADFMRRHDAQDKRQDKQDLRADAMDRRTDDQERRIEDDG